MMSRQGIAGKLKVNNSNAQYEDAEAEIIELTVTQTNEEQLTLLYLGCALSVVGVFIFVLVS